MFQLYLHYEYWIAASQLVLAMLGMGATLRGRDFAEVLVSPTAIGVGIVIQLVWVPLLAAGFLALFELETGMAVGLALCAAIPGGTISNVLTFVGRGHVALSIALTGLTTLACLVTTPALLRLLIAGHLPPDFSMPAAAIALEIGLALLLPLVLGMGVLALWPDRAARFSRWCIRGSLGLLGVIVIGALGSGRVDLVAFGLYNLGVTLLLLACLVASSWLLPRALGLSARDVTAINIEVTVRNGSLGVMIAASLFPAVGPGAGAYGANVLFTVLVYAGAGVLAGLALMRLHRRLNQQLPVGD